MHLKTIKFQSQVVRHLMPPIPLNLATTSMVMDCSSAPCSALVTITPDPGVISCGSFASGQDTLKTTCVASTQVKRKLSFLISFLCLRCTETNHFMKGGCGHQDNLSIFQKHLPRILSHLSSCFFQSFVSPHVLLSQENSVLGFL